MAGLGFGISSGVFSAQNERVHITPPSKSKMTGWKITEFFKRRYQIHLHSWLGFPAYHSFVFQGTTSFEKWKKNSRVQSDLEMFGKGSMKGILLGHETWISFNSGWLIVKPRTGETTWLLFRMDLLTITPFFLGRSWKKRQWFETYLQTLSNFLSQKKAWISQWMFATFSEDSAFFIDSCLYPGIPKVIPR